MKFEFIHAKRGDFPVAALCKVLGVSRTGYYDWIDREPSKREHEDFELVKEIKAIHASSRGTYGSPRIHRKLRRERPISRRRVARLMRENGLKGARPKRFRKTTDSSHGKRCAPNLLDRDFSANRKNRKWAGDITYVWTNGGWLYLAVLIDLHSRRVVGWSLAKHLGAELVTSALRMALGRRRPPAGLLHHSDRGGQYLSDEYLALLKSIDAKRSMSRAGDCWDNGVVESFFATLKKELIHRYRWLSREDASEAITEYIEVFYNNHRLHSSLGYLSPSEYEASHSNRHAGLAAA